MSFQFRFNKYIISDIKSFEQKWKTFQFRFNKYIASDIKSFKQRRGRETYLNWLAGRQREKPRSSEL
jgi:hypothetical protein